MRAAELAARLQAMLGEAAGVGWAEIAGADGLFPGEAEAVARAVPERRAEFAAGRRAARAALAALGRPDAEIPVGPNRAPAWPEGVAGAITHDRGVALAAVITRPCGGVGIDLTEAAPLPKGTRATILLHAEEAGLTDLEARAAFSAKESLFKALFPRIETFFGFEAAVFACGPASGVISLRLAAPLGPFGDNAVFRGRVAVEGDSLLTALILPI